jgi:hypothetical protein
MTITPFAGMTMIDTKQGAIPARRNQWLLQPILTLDFRDLQAADAG